MNPEAELDELLATPAPSREDIEAVLTHGHAVALELEADRLRIRRKLERARAAADPALAGVVAALDEELSGVTTRLRSLHGRLSDARSLFGPGRILSDRGR